MERNTYKRLEGYMLSCMKDSAHDREHVYRVLNNAVAIARNETGVDWDVLIASALLHDISRAEQLADPSVCHALHGAEKAYTFLMAEGVDEDFAAHVRACIQTHRFRKAMPPQSLEARILFDADKLDVAGAIGIARTLEYNGASGRPLYHRNEDGRISDGRHDTQDSFCREYRFKLENIYDHFLTESGRAMAAKRQNAATSFFSALMDEVDVDIDLSGILEE